MRVRGPHIQIITDIIVKSFTEDELKSLLIINDDFGENIVNEFSGSSYQDKAFNLVKLLNRRELVRKFLSAVRDAPGHQWNQSLKNVCDSYIDIYDQYNIWKLEEIFSQIQLDYLKKVFRSFQEKNINLRETIAIKQINDIIIRLLQDYPRTSSKDVSIFCLAQFLAQSLENETPNDVAEECQNNLRRWIEDNKNRHGIKCSIPDTRDEIGNGKAYLLITVNPTAKKDNFRLKGELIIFDEDKNKYNDRYNLELDNQDGYTECNFNQISETISKFIDITWKDHLEHRTLHENISWDLTIELFLPIKYLVEDFDMKPIQEPIGKEYHFVVRSYDRVYKGKYWSKFLEKWKHMLNTENSQIKIRNLGQNFNWDEVENINLFQEGGLIFGGLANLERKKREKIESLFNEMLCQGIIVCLWSRCLLSEEAFLEIENLSQDFSNLHHKVFHMRNQENPTNNLGVMCENPYRKPTSRGLG